MSTHTVRHSHAANASGRSIPQRSERGDAGLVVLAVALNVAMATLLVLLFLGRMLD